MASGAEQINIAVHNVNELSHKTREDVQILMQEISRFKID
jgi:methyl-accepting chemotaxis protein